MKKVEIRKLDKLWSDLVKKLANYRCELCHRTGIRVEAAHIIGRAHRATRWGLLINGKYDLCGMCLCHYCHRSYDEHRPNEKQIREEVIGLERYNNIVILSNGIKTNMDFKETERILKKYETK